MIDSLYKKSPRIRDHTEKAMEYGEKLALALNLSPSVRKTIEKTIYYQEVGKITIPKKLLNKTQGFTKRELEEINKHPGVGYRILNTVNDMIEVAKYVLYHHEKYDGSGYPKGLRGSRIPFISRLVAVVDFYVYSLMIEGKEATVSKDIAIRKLRENAGTYLDPELVNIFIEEVLKNE